MGVKLPKALRVLTFYQAKPLSSSYISIRPRVPQTVADMGDIQTGWVRGVRLCRSLEVGDRPGRSVQTRQAGALVVGPKVDLEKSWCGNQRYSPAKPRRRMWEV